MTGTETPSKRPSKTGNRAVRDTAVESSTMNSMRVSIVVPTYCEAENVRPLCERVFAATRAAGIDAELVFVDDASPDETVAVVNELAASYPVRAIVRRNERGLSSAVVRGFAESDRELLVCMDADLSHPPEVLPEVIGMVARGEADFCIGSRYVAGGELSDEWGPLRRLNSLVATWLARPLIAARDPMAGFFCLRRETFEAARSNGLTAIGYKIGLEICVRARCKRIREIPIRFEERSKGASKLGARQQFQYLYQLARLYVACRPVMTAGAIVIVVTLAAVAFLTLR